MKHLLHIAALLFLVGGVVSYLLDNYPALLLFSLLSAVTLLLLSSLQSKIGIFSLTTGGLIAMTAYSFAVPIHFYFLGDYKPDIVMIALFASFLAINSQYVGYVIGQNIRLVRFQKDTIIPTSKYYTIGQFILFAGFASSILAVILTVGFSVYLDAGYAGRALLKRNVGPVELGLYHMIIGIIILSVATHYDTRKRRAIFYKLAVIVLAVGLAVYVTFLGIRRPSFFIIAALFYLYMAFRRKNSLLLISGAALFASFFALFSNFRQVLSDGGNVSGSYDFILENISWQWLDLSRGELGAPFRAFMDVIEGWSEQGLRYGSTYAEGFINLIPSGIYKYGNSLSVEYTHYFFSWEYIAIGGNMGFFPVAEAYLNFRLPGVILEFVLIGILIQIIEKSVVRTDNFRSYVVYAFTLPWFFFFIRTDFSSFLKSFFYSILAPYVLFVFYENWQRRKQRKKEKDKTRIEATV